MMKFLAKVTSSDLTKAMSSISAWDGKTRLAIENALQDSTKNIARGAKQKVAQRSGKLKKSIKTGFDRRKPEGLVKAKTPYALISLSLVLRRILLGLRIKRLYPFLLAVIYCLENLPKFLPEREGRLLSLPLTQKSLSLFLT